MSTFCEMRLKCACYRSLLILAFTFLCICHMTVYFAYLLWPMTLKSFKQMKNILKKMTGKRTSGLSSRRPRDDDGDDHIDTPPLATLDAGASQPPSDAGTGTIGIRMFMFQF